MCPSFSDVEWSAAFHAYVCLFSELHTCLPMVYLGFTSDEF